VEQSGLQESADRDEPAVAIAVGWCQLSMHDPADHKLQRPAQKRGGLDSAVMLRRLVLRKQKKCALDALEKNLLAVVISLRH
jgi:hypothetical protein